MDHYLESRYALGQAGGPYWGRFPRILPPTLIVIHSTRSGIPERPDSLELSSTLNHFHNGVAGAHVVVSSLGDIYWIVPFNWCAWGATYLNPFAIHIELTQPTADTPYSEGHYRGCAEVIRRIINIYPSIPLVHVATEEGLGIIGHSETAQGQFAGKSDPGYLFSWEILFSELGGDQVPSIVDSLNKGWEILSEIQQIAGPGAITDLAEDVKQKVIVEIKKSIGLQ